MELKYYLYFSDSKLDMLFPQLSRFDKIKLQFSLGFKRTFIRFDIKDEKHEMNKMKQLSKYILKKCEVGNIENPKSYIKDVAKLKWGIIPMDAGDMVLFFIKKEGLIFVLGGTPKHLVTKRSLPKINKQSRSDLFGILTFFKSLDYKTDFDVKQLELISQREIPEAIDYISSNEKLVEQELEFLAKFFMETKYDFDEKMRVVIGSPIYVATT